MSDSRISLSCPYCAEIHRVDASVVPPFVTCKRCGVEFEASPQSDADIAEAQLSDADAPLPMQYASLRDAVANSAVTAFFRRRFSDWVDGGRVRDLHDRSSRLRRDGAPPYDGARIAGYGLGIIGLAAIVLGGVGALCALCAAPLRLFGVMSTPHYSSIVGYGEPSLSETMLFALSRIAAWTTYAVIGFLLIGAGQLLHMARDLAIARYQRDTQSLDRMSGKHS